MMMTNTIIDSFRKLRAATAVMAIGVLGMACSDILDVQDPDIVTPENLAGEAGLATLRAGAFGDLAIALSGSAAGHGATPGLIVHAALMTDEMIYSGTFPTRRELDERAVLRNNGTMSGVFQRLHRARTALRTAAETIEEFSSNASTDSRIAEMWSLTGVVYNVFGEIYCSGVPFSTAQEDGTLDFGAPMATQAMFQAAVERADRALANTGGSATQDALARVVRARALVNMGNFSEAAATVATVPDDFVYNLEHSLNSLRQQNGIYIMSTIRRQYSIAEGKGGTGILFRSAGDPRVLWDDPARNGQDDQTPYMNQLKYADEAAPVALATGVEARLIEAENAMQPGGDVPLFQSIHDALRATMSLPSVDVSAMTQTQREDFHFSERAFWMYVTGRRLGDLRRLVRQYGRDPATVFPTGTYFKGGTYGGDMNLPLPLQEDNNPNSSGCLDRSA